MKNNMAVWDRVVRAVIAIALALLFFSDMVTGTLGIVSPGHQRCFFTDSNARILSAVPAIQI